ALGELFGRQGAVLALPLSDAFAAGFEAQTMGHRVGRPGTEGRALHLRGMVDGLGQVVRPRHRSLLALHHEGTGSTAGSTTCQVGPYRSPSPALNDVFGGHSASAGPSMVAPGCPYNDTPGPPCLSVYAHPSYKTATPGVRPRISRPAHQSGRGGSVSPVAHGPPKTRVRTASWPASPCRLSFGMLLAILAFAPASAAFGQANDAQPPAGLKVTVSSISDKVRQYQQAEARVTVENAALVPLTIHEVVVEPSAELRVCPSFTSPPAKGSDGCEAQEKPEPLTIGPGDAKVLRWVITVPDRSSASKHPISFEIDYGDHPARTAVATTTIDMTAIGDTGVL